MSICRRSHIVYIFAIASSGRLVEMYGCRIHPRLSVNDNARIHSVEIGPHTFEKKRTREFMAGQIIPKLS
jgi:hypothetical protein